jgi:hypothetical protein
MSRDFWIIFGPIVPGLSGQIPGEIAQFLLMGKNYQFVTRVQARSTHQSISCSIQIHFSLKIPNFYCF